MRRLLLWLAVLAAAAGIQAGPALGHRDGAYWHDTGPAAHYPDWMSGVHDDAVLSDVSIPGSHDSGTYPGLGADLIIGLAGGGGLVGLLTPLCPPCAVLVPIVAPIVINDVAQTQTMNIEDSLESGIRYFDLRLRYYDYPNKTDCTDDASASAGCDLYVFHGPFPYTTKFGPDVLQPVMKFLAQHPTEFVVMKVAEVGAPTDVRGPLDTLLDGTFIANGAEHRYEDFLLRSNEDADPTTTGTQPCSFDRLPVGATSTTSTPVPGCTARGKLLLLPTGLGTPAADHYYEHLGDLNTVDNYHEVNTNYDLHEYFQEAKAHFRAANDVNTDHSKVYINQLNTSLGGFPYFFASGHSSKETGDPRLSTGLVTGLSADFDSTYPDFPRVVCLANIFTPSSPFCTIAFEGMNVMTADYLSKTDIGSYSDPCSDAEAFWDPGACADTFVDNKNFRPGHPEFHTATSRVGIVLADFPGKRLIEAIANVNPGVELGGPALKPLPRLSALSYVGDEGTPITFDASGSRDGNGQVDSSLTYVWSLSENGNIDNGCVRVDGQGPKIYQDAANLFASSHPGLTGAALAQAFQASQAGKDAQAALDNDPGNKSTATFVCADNTSATVKVTVFDGPASASTTANVTINDVAPTVTIDPAQLTSALEGSALSVRATYTDPGSRDTHTASVDLGTPDRADVPGTVNVTAQGPPTEEGQVTASISYGDNGAFTVTVRVLDDDGVAGEGTFGVTVANVNPTAAIDETGALAINGVGAIFGDAGTNTSLAARVQDPGSDDETTRWDWGDGTPPTVRKSQVNPPFDDPTPSPTLQPRDYATADAHAWTRACLYDVAFGVTDDDLGTASSDRAKVLITAPPSLSRGAGYWQHEYRGNGAIQFTPAQLDCYLKIVSFLSTVFDDVRDASTRQKAYDVIFVGGSKGSMSEQLDRQLLTAWVNFANGAVEYAEMLDTNRDGSLDTSFADVMAAAEAVRLSPASTRGALQTQRDILTRINERDGA